MLEKNVVCENLNSCTAFYISYDKIGVWRLFKSVLLGFRVRNHNATDIFVIVGGGNEL